MRHFWPLVLFIIIFVVAIVGQKQAKPIQNTQYKSPQRIITLAPSITEMAFALGLDDKVIAVTNYCDYPAKVNLLPKVGGYINPNIEAIVALQPDLVIVIASQVRTIKQFQQLNIPTLAVYNSNLEDIKTSIKMIGDATQHQDQAQNLLTEIEHKITNIHNEIIDYPHPKVMITMGHSMNSKQVKIIYIAGQHDFYNDLITLAGGQNAYQGQHLKIPSLSIEGIMQLNPEVIIDIFPEADDHNTNIIQAKQRWMNLNHVNAVKNNRVYIIEENYATIPGPRIFKLLDKLARLIHPEINWDKSAL